MIKGFRNNQDRVKNKTSGSQVHQRRATGIQIFQNNVPDYDFT